MARPETCYELMTCALRGHVLVGTDAEAVTADDALVARLDAGMRWHRCLRCDGWFPVTPPDPPSRERIPERSEIELPRRGPELRDRYVLRLIALDRAIHVVVLTGLAVAIFFVLGHQASLRHDYAQIMNALTGSSGGKGTHGLLGDIHRLLVLDPRHLFVIGLAVIAYAALEAVEMVGLWFAKRWAEYLTFVATIVLVPLEVAELATSVSTLKVVTLVINVAIAVYLLLAKRLFGLRGGWKAEEGRRRALGGWAAVERASVGGEAGVGVGVGGVTGMTGSSAISGDESQFVDAAPATAPSRPPDRADEAEAPTRT